MKLKLNSHDLKNALNKIQTVVDKKSTRPILANCLLNAEDNQLIITATDLEVSAQIKLNAEILEPGKLCINTKNFSDIVRELPESNLELSTDEDNLLHLNCESIHYSLLVTNTDEYPQINFNHSEDSIKISTNNFLNIIAKTFYATSTDETRIYLNGIYLESIDNNLRAVAIDGHRLAMLDKNEFIGNDANLKSGIIIPRKGLLELKKLAESYSEGSIQLTIDDSFLYAKVNNDYQLSVRLILREYPRYQSVIPNKTVHGLKVNKDLLLNAVKRIRILSNEKTNGIKVVLKPNEAVLSANHPTYGKAIENVPIQYQGPETQIGFNARYLIDGLSVFNSGDIDIEFNNELSPVVFKSHDFENYLGIVMPLKI